jgi:uncharacterized membrane protein
MTKPDPSTDGSQTKAGSNGLIALPVKLPHHPVVLEEQERRAADIQLRIADWMLFYRESPWPTLTLIVSLEAIFLSTFVMIGQNRQASFQQAKADHDFNEQGLELKTNTELTREIDQLTTELHRRLIDHRSQQKK